MNTINVKRNGKLVYDKTFLLVSAVPAYILGSILIHWLGITGFILTLVLYHVSYLIWQRSKK